jgi:hypothetical protein
MRAVISLGPLVAIFVALGCYNLDHAAPVEAGLAFGLAALFSGMALGHAARR